MTAPPTSSVSSGTAARRYTIGVVALAGLFAALSLALNPASLRTTALRLLAIVLVGVLVDQGRRWARRCRHYGALSSWDTGSARSGVCGASSDRLPPLIFSRGVRRARVASHSREVPPRPCSQPRSIPLSPNPNPGDPHAARSRDHVLQAW